MSGTLHAPRLSFEQAANECAAVRVAIHQVAHGCRERATETLAEHQARVRKAKRDAASEAIHRTIWPAPRLAMIGCEYPDAARDSVDAWARAGTAHGVLDYLDGKDPRVLDADIRLDKRLSYIAAYFQARGLMGDST